MNTSRDVKALFDRFGGDASSYQEIRMENEALDARRRWPLLGMIDPRQAELAAASGQPDEARAAASPAEAGARGKAATQNRTHAVLRSTAPLFTRSPRRDVPPAIAPQPAPAAPEGSTYRFTPAPDAAAMAAEPAELAAPAVALAAATAGADTTAAEPAATLLAPLQASLAPRDAVSVPPSAVTPVVVAPAATAPAGAGFAPAAPPAPAATATAAPATIPTPPAAPPPAAPMSLSRAAAQIAPRLALPRTAEPPRRAMARGIFTAPIGAAARLPSHDPLGRAPVPLQPAPALKKLAAGAPARPGQPQRAGAAEADGERLDSLFTRLRHGGSAPAPAAPKSAAEAPRRPWFLRGAPRS
ncbi:cellulose biosynthesis protein BcsP [Burkholderia gladioli]|uniref:cellulose biosynthesis protein BcsP n=1 Tax=Burkholderia gladioli TaxID=28095 RepID=UPI001F4BBED8|nr:cellulose biosynthesis protein BcsP [Burkholderia gladioli]MCH7274062.1 cellulose biosynthesis protein BcsP [Burkholderia gladioli]MDZ4038723.1 cellulose biosynthesis protein BcsP [Burkholderia gladioli pv. alliicola]